MGKSLDVSDRIATLRSKRGETQAQFAAAVGVTQQSVSDWESKTGDAVPSADSYARLGNLAPYPDCLWFWEQAGMSKDAMLSAASKRLKERGEVPESKMLAVPRFDVTTRTTDKSQSLLWDAARVPNPGAVAYWDVGGHLRAAVQWPLNTKILLDTSANDAADLQAFYDRNVLVEARPVDRPTLDPLAPEVGLHLGRLTITRMGGAWHESNPWFAMLWYDPHLIRPQWASEIAGRERALGRWTISMTTDKWRLQKMTDYGLQFDGALVEARAREEVRLYPNCTILGRVLAYVLPDETK
jgi:transcriptional regulator with XRE-family HTH domain